MAATEYRLPCPCPWDTVTQRLEPLLPEQGYTLLSPGFTHIWRKGMDPLPGSQYLSLRWAPGSLTIALWSGDADPARGLGLDRMGPLPRKGLEGTLALLQARLALLREEFSAPPPQLSPLPPLRAGGLARYSPLIDKALSLSFLAHRDQRDKAGAPYVYHPFTVAAMLETEEEIAAALLHDVVEDTDLTLADLRREGIPEAVLAALALLTHPEGAPYLAYVARLRKDPIARRVKLADLAHNSRQDRLPAQRQDRRRLLKYAMARAILEDDYYDSYLRHYRKVLPLDLDRLCFLSVFYSPRGQVTHYSLDVEAASDSHYQFSSRDGDRLLAHWKAPSLPEGLALWLEENSPHRFPALLRGLGISLQTHHFG